MAELHGKVALVTGGTRGIGREIALEFARAGADVAIVGRKHSEDADAVLAEVHALGRKAHACFADLSNATDAASAVAKASAALGPISLLVNNAGINPSKPLDQISPVDWNEAIGINLSSAFYVTQAVLPAMRAQQWGRIIMLSSVAAQLGGVIGPHYAASKAGLIGMMHGYAALLAKEGITVNAIAPALIETEMLKSNNRIRPDLIPIGRFGKVEEVASIALMLAGNGYITGQTINANGGWYMS
ncbi:SDR family NAD(P)-dependent oxidoreductase [Granulicella sibirica]|uniref:3-oxoacyl-[acyl-carrier protein] reductase n=1 Tax=Granulicella sibirica TaxID=2479048 RepID=A0A4V1L5V2_9BACT|nr:SDR family NAD(P)-dependent oxidoreductase [Granulicella sibirica]RXH57054.1 3-oxoacyl-[acyl-carrier protein] reductase [Granulicella sibirica]